MRQKPASGVFVLTMLLLAPAARRMEEVTLAVERGRLLGPFARMLLPIACLREHHTTKAHEVLIGLERDFHSNPHGSWRVQGFQVPRVCQFRHPGPSPPPR